MLSDVTRIKIGRSSHHNYRPSDVPLLAKECREGNANPTVSNLRRLGGHRCLTCEWQTPALTSPLNVYEVPPDKCLPWPTVLSDASRLAGLAYRPMWWLISHPGCPPLPRLPMRRPWTQPAVPNAPSRLWFGMAFFQVGLTFLRPRSCISVSYSFASPRKSGTFDLVQVIRVLFREQEHRGRGRIPFNSCLRFDITKKRTADLQSHRLRL